LEKVFFENIYVLESQRSVFDFKTDLDSCQTRESDHVRSFASCCLVYFQGSYRVWKIMEKKFGPFPAWKSLEKIFLVC